MRESNALAFKQYNVLLRLCISHNRFGRCFFDLSAMPFCWQILNGRASYQVGRQVHPSTQFQLAFYRRWWTLPILLGRGIVGRELDCWKGHRCAYRGWWDLWWYAWFCTLLYIFPYKSAKKQSHRHDRIAWLLISPHRSSVSTLPFGGCCAVIGLVPRALFIGRINYIIFCYVCQQFLRCDHASVWNNIEHYSVPSKWFWCLTSSSSNLLNISWFR